MADIDFEVMLEVILNSLKCSTNHISKRNNHPKPDRKWDGYLFPFVSCPCYSM